MTQLLMQVEYHQCDETYFQVNKDGREAGTKSFMWVHITSELVKEHPIVVYCFELTRGTDHLRKFYEDFKGYITCDAYISYHILGEENADVIIICGCMMHLRRRFVKSLSLINTKGLDYDTLKIRKYLKKVQKDNLLIGYKNGGYSCKYVDETIQIYADYIQKFIDTSNTYNDAFRKYSLYPERTILIINYSKRKLEFDGAVKAAAALKKASESLTEAFLETDRFIAQWLYETLDVKNNDFHKIKIDYVRFAQLVEKMEVKRMNLYLTLTQYGYGHLIHKALLQ